MGHEIFVVGCPRSGTTWTLDILRKHPLVLTSSESHLYPELFDRIVRDGLDREARDALLERYDVQPLGEKSGLHKWVERDELAALLDAAAASDLSREDAAEHVIARVLDGFRARHGASPDTVLVEKTPRHLFYTDRILRLFPDARIVEVLRDGRDVCVSLQMRSALVAWAPRRRVDQILRWVEAVQHGKAMRATPEAAGRWYVFRFEDAKSDPPNAIADLFGFCGLPFDDSLIGRVADQTDFARLRTTGDDQHYRRGDVGGWQDHFDEADRALFEQLAGETFTAAGYRL